MKIRSWWIVWKKKNMVAAHTDSFRARIFQPGIFACEALGLDLSLWAQKTYSHVVWPQYQKTEK
jgi:peptide methionine sulfoxide reductase MsrB